jgi:hypothetical protein
MKFLDRANRSRGLTANVHWNDDFEDWSVTCIRGTRRIFSHTSDGFPVDVSKYAKTDQEKLLADLSAAIPQCNFVVK